MTASDGASLLLRGPRAGLTGPRADVLVAAGRVQVVAPVGSLEPGEAEVVAVQDATLLPGLVDQHVHVDQWVHTSRRVDVGSAGSAAEVVSILLAEGSQDAGRSPRVVTGAGYVDGLWTEPAHRRLLDDAFGSRPAAVVSVDLHAVWLNGAALALVGAGDHPTGVLREGEGMTAMRALMDAEPDDVVDGWVAAALDTVAVRGVTGLVDFEYADNLTVWRRRAERSPSPVRVAAAVWLPWLDAAEGLGTGDSLVPDGSVTVGPLKLMADGSLNTRTAYCHDAYLHAPATERYGLRLLTTGDLVEHLTAAVDAGLVPAVHAIGDHAVSDVLDAFERVGCGGRIEHAQLVRDEDLPRFAALGVAASVQPSHLVADRDVAERQWPGRTGRSFPYAALHAAGAELLLGSDAPVSPLDPWRAVADAVARTADDRPPWHPEQALPLDVALAAASDGRRTVEPGMPADLTVVPGDIASASPDELRAATVLLTTVGGRVTHRSF